MLKLAAYIDRSKTQLRPVPSPAGLLNLSKG